MSDGNGDGKLQLYVGPRDRNGRKLVTATMGGVELHRDCIDTDVAFAREMFCKTAVARHTAQLSALGIQPASTCMPLTEDEIAEYNLRGSVGGGHNKPAQPEHGWLEWELRKRADEVDQAEVDREAGAVEYQILTAAELDAGDYREEWHVDSWLVARQPMIAAAPSKGMKTTIIAALLLHLATGTPFLGRFAVARAVRVLFFSAESGLSTLQKTMRSIARSVGIELGNIGNIFVCPQAPQLASMAHLDAIRKALADREVEVLAIDPAYLCLDPNGSENSMFAMGVHLAAINAVCQEMGVTLILIHHCKKTGGAPGEPLDLGAIAWSGFEQFARQWLLLSRREPYQPDVPGVHKLWAAVGGSAGHSSLWGLNIDEGPHDARRWDVEALPAADIRNAKEDGREQAKAEKTSEQLRRDHAALVRAAAKFPSGETLKAIRETAALGGTRSQLALAAALDAGDLVPCEVLKSTRKTPYEGYRLSNGKGDK